DPSRYLAHLSPALPRLSRHLARLTRLLAHLSPTLPHLLRHLAHLSPTLPRLSRNLAHFRRLCHAPRAISALLSSPRPSAATNATVSRGRDERDRQPQSRRPRPTTADATSAPTTRADATSAPTGIAAATDAGSRRGRDKLELLIGTTAVNWVSFEESLFTYLGSVRVGDYCLLDVVLETPHGLPPTPPPLPGSSPPEAPPLPTEPAPQAPILGAWEDDPDRWARTLNKYNKERDDYVIKGRAHAAAVTAHEAVTAKLAEFKAISEAYSTNLRKHHSNTAAWRIADRRELVRCLMYLMTCTRPDLACATLLPLYTNNRVDFQRWEADRQNVSQWVR
ncbi:unnamed protein product, partial [Closterium sp. NIES-53]